MSPAYGKHKEADGIDQRPSPKDLELARHRGFEVILTIILEGAGEPIHVYPNGYQAESLEL